MRFGKRLLRDWLAGAFPQAGAHARKQGFKPPVGAWMAARAGEIVPLLTAHPALAGLLAPPAIDAAFRAAADRSQPAWSLLFFALWHGRHVLGVDARGDIGEVLREAARLA
jgi:asparagine synthase (glutamine-hydrolysing)